MNLLQALADSTSVAMEAAGLFANLEKRVAEVTARHVIGKVPRPPNWSGFRLRPLLIEFWQDGAFRLHDRLEYRRPAPGEPWTTRTLYP